MSLSVEVNPAGFMTNPSEWTEDVMRELAESQSMELTDEIVEYVHKAREHYDTYSVVPPLREFAKSAVEGMEGRKAVKHLNAVFNGGPMKKIALIGGLPQPTGCV